VFYCDECREQATLYEYNGKELCAECLLKNFDIVEGSDEDGIF
jgi:Zn finger protein HypA/HybF involved in hydrogenase expression